MADLTPHLRGLHDEYAERLNLAVAEDRDDLVAALATEFEEEAIGLLALSVLPAILASAGDLAQRGRSGTGVRHHRSTPAA